MRLTDYKNRGFVFVDHELASKAKPVTLPGYPTFFETNEAAWAAADSVESQRRKRAREERIAAAERKALEAIAERDKLRREAETWPAK